MINTRRRDGFTFVELALVMAVLLSALLIFSSTISGVARQRAVNRESSLAMEAARNELEILRSEDFSALFALFNDDPTDDPNGAGTAPGHRFVVKDLDAAPGLPDGLAGEIWFPSSVDPVNGLELREDVVDHNLGMPRDLSGDGVIDAQDHAASYFILPVRIRVRWKGKSGVRQYELSSQICTWNKS